MQDVAIAGMVNLSMDGARGRFVEALKALSEDLTRKKNIRDTSRNRNTLKIDKIWQTQQSPSASWERQE